MAFQMNSGLLSEKNLLRYHFIYTPCEYRMLILQDMVGDMELRWLGPMLSCLAYDARILGLLGLGICGRMCRNCQYGGHV
jgi:hypothetical protein